MKYNSKLIYIISVLSVALIWQISAVIIDSPLILPKLTDTVLKLSELTRTQNYWENIGFTVARVLFSFFLTITLGIPLGLLRGKYPFFRDFLAFPVSVLRATPVVAIILILLFSFSSNFVPVVVSLLMALPMTVSTISESLIFTKDEEKLFFMAKIFSLSKFQKLRFIFLPKFKPFFKAAAVSAFGMTWKVTIAGEVLSIPKYALGSKMATAQVHLETQEVYALLITIIFLSYFFNILLKLIMTSSRNIREKKTKIRDFSKFNEIKDISNNEEIDIKIENLNISFDEKKIFEDFSLFIPFKKKIYFFAPSGRGKTTLLHEIAKKYTDKISIVFQEPRLIENLSVLENVALPLQNIYSKEKALSRAEFFLQKVNLSEKLYSFPENLSGGEKQRVSIARALAFSKPIFLLDEPFNSLDEKNKKIEIDFVKEITKNSTVVLVSHDKKEAEKICSEILEF